MTGHDKTESAVTIDRNDRSRSSGIPTSGLGLLLGQGFAAGLGWLLRLDNSLLIGGMAWPPELVWVPCLALGVSLVSALLPTFAAYRVSVLSLLQSR